MNHVDLGRAETGPARPARDQGGRRFNTYENRLLLVLSLGGGVAALDAQALFYLSPFVAKDLRLNNAEIGMLSSAVLVTWSIAAYLIGGLSDRTGRRKPYLILAYALFAVCSFLSGLARNFATLLLARLTVGLAEGPVIPLSQSIMAANSTPSRRGFNMGVVQNFGAQLFGSLLGPILVVGLATTLNWRAAFFLAGLPGLVIAASLLVILKEPAAASPTQPDGRNDILKILSVRNVWICCIVAGAMIGWFVLLLSFLPLYLVNFLHLSPRMMSFAMATIGAAGAVSAVLVPMLSDRFGRRPTIVLFGVLGAIAPLAALARPDAPVMIGLIFFGCLALGMFPLFMGTVPQESVGVSRAARSTALVMGLGQCIGGFVGPSLAGAAADYFSLKAPLVIAIFLAIIGGVTALLLNETAPVAAKISLGQNNSRG
ncbi:MFS transporter [Phenylobacterium montanum]|uniref:MFS transporter n=1 Tax=Phenylobacterium montanum TaxID=2823693 RepID=A0A975G569_9CAUL|nr:MFS transporter [Caulobacter sp. S6]QUD90251.1 MFS transporter [Caulobacter sp. S6]